MVTLRLRPHIIEVFLKMFPLIKGFLSNLDQVHLTLGEIYHLIQLLVIVEALSQCWVHCLFQIFFSVGITNYLIRTADPIGVLAGNKRLELILTLLESGVLPITLIPYMVQIVGLEPTRHNDTRPSI